MKNIAKYVNDIRWWRHNTFFRGHLGLLGTQEVSHKSSFSGLNSEIYILYLYLGN